MKTLGIFSVIDSELASEIKKDVEAGNELSREHGLDLATKQLPKKDDPKRAFFGPVTAFFNQIVAKARTRLQSAFSKWDMTRAQKELNEKRDRISKDLIEVNNIIRLKNRELEKWEKSGDLAPLQKQKREKKLKPFLFAGIVLDVAISCTALMKMGWIFPIALGFGIVLGAMIFLLSDNFLAILHRFKRPLVRRLVGVAIFIGVFILFLIIGTMRAESMSRSSFSSPLMFCFMNMFVFASVVAVTVVVKPSPAELKLIDKYKALKNEITEAEQKKRALEKALDDALAEFHTKQEERDKLVLYSKDVEALIVAHYESAIQTLVSANLQRRSDGIIPDMFSQDPPALTLHFTHKKTI